MCECKNGATLSMNPCAVQVMYHPGTGNPHTIVNRVVTMAATTNVIASGIEPLPSSVEIDSEGKKFVRVTLNFKSEPSLPKLDIGTPVVHIVELAQADLDAISGFDENTYILFDKKLNGHPIPSAKPSGGNCLVTVRCKWIESSGYPYGGYWYCVAYLNCDWGHGAYEIIVK